jgi:hypothetical protein
MIFIHLCPIAWSIYDRRRWRALDKHRAICCECYRKEVDA